MATERLDIWELLRNIDDGNRDFLQECPPELAKTFAPIVVLRWLSGGSESQLLNLNELVNSTVFNLHRHPDLLYDLMLAATPPGRKNYNWVKLLSRKSQSKRMSVICRYLDTSPNHAHDFAALYSSEDIVEMAEHLGETSEFIKALKAEMK